ncbi:hypothetical protein CSC94_12720 [Zhengella mangrovi]|uniref:Phage head-tail adapter protein n=1 Tax=Zhengella mangrovi TaxID=1982044 RepID=A0A2G1QLZ5_9HYPH|nr:hypothetical protein [Zhengella mangrovi]PHP66546.1 hypothetical protein CSC94_12720 [Zhengella mangrovi]
MIDVAQAIDDESVTVTLKTKAAGSYDADGKWVAGADSDPLTIFAAVFPIGQNGKNLEDMPEGIRAEVDRMMWTRAAISVEDRVTFAGRTWRVMHVWDRSTEGGFYRGALGGVK